MNRRYTRSEIERALERIRAAAPDLFITTIHDSILTEPDAGDYIHNVMLEEFAKLGVSPTVRVEPA